MKNKFKMNLQLFGGMNPDRDESKKTEVMQKLNQALKDGDEEGFAQAFTDFANDLQQSVIQEARSITANVDTQILASRGVRQLTSEETKYYQKVIEAMKSTNPQQALTELDVVMPTTTIDAVFEDLETNHPLLSAIDFQNAGAVTEWL